MINQEPKSWKHVSCLAIKCFFSEQLFFATQMCSVLGRALYTQWGRNLFWLSILHKFLILQWFTTLFPQNLVQFCHMLKKFWSSPNECEQAQNNFGPIRRTYFLKFTLRILKWKMSLTYGKSWKAPLFKLITEVKFRKYHVKSNTNSKVFWPQCTKYSIDWFVAHR